jgi:hypothetical protein
MLHEMKGVGETVMVGRSPMTHRPVELARFPDGSWAIRKGGSTVGVWEPGERGECLRVFNMLVGLGGGNGTARDATGPAPDGRPVKRD